MENIYALYYEYADERRYFYVGRTNDPKRRLGEHRSNVKNTKHREDVYQFIRERCQPNGIDVWNMEVLVTEANQRPEDCEDFWVVLMIRAGHDLKNMKHGDLHRIALNLMARQRLDLDFTTVEEFIEFREIVEREQREAYERSERLKRSVLGEEEGDPVLLQMVRNNTERFREQNAERVRKRLKKEERARAEAREKEQWLKTLRDGMQKRSEAEQIEEEDRQYARWMEMELNGGTDDKIIARRMLESIEQSRRDRKQNETKHQS